MKSVNCFVVAGMLSCVLLFPLLLSCSKNEGSPPVTRQQPPPPPPPEDISCAGCQLLYYGGDNSDAPTLRAGSYQAAARYTPEKIGNLMGKTIKEIRFFIVTKPDLIQVNLYGPKTSAAPGNLLYSADVTGTSEAYTWNIHKLNRPITLKSEDIWLSIAFTISNSRRTIGCDPGPALRDGDWLFSSMDESWAPFSRRDGGASINWTIRLNVG